MRKLLFINHKGFYIQALTAEVESPRTPVAVIKGDIILEASGVAQAWGVRGGLPKTLGQRRCPELVCIEFNPVKCQPLFDQTWSVYAELTPQVEPVALHQGFIDLTGCGHKDKTLCDTMHAVDKRLRVLGITGEWGGGQDRWIARLACGENRFILSEQEEEFLASVSIKRLLPDGLCERLLRYSVRTVAELAALPRHFTETHLQISSQQIRPYLVRDTASVRGLFPPPQIEAEVEVDWLRLEHLDNALDELCANLEKQLAESDLEAAQLCAEFMAPRKKELYEITVSRPLHLAEQAKHFLTAYILEKQLRRLQKIRVVLNRLTPRARMQSDLWHDPQTNLERHDQLLRAQETVKRKHGQAMLENGHETALRRRPRFAQLIYELRGIYLP